MHEVLVNRLGGLSLPTKSVVRLTDRPDMTLDVYRGRKTTIQQLIHVLCICNLAVSMFSSNPVTVQCWIQHKNSYFSWLGLDLVLSIAWSFGVYLGPVVQSIVSLTSSLRGQLVKYITTL